MSNIFERDTALGIADKLARVTDEHGIFVLTGSYSIEALTRGNVSHNDIDANLFVKNALTDQVTIVDQAITSNVVGAERIFERADRLEYAIQSGERLETAELQFLEYADYKQASAGGMLILPGSNEAGNSIQVPLAAVELVDSRGASYEFKVKSLNYAIATWAIRISGIINYQKRQVRRTDIDHFALLLDQPYDNDSVYDALAHHPQMIAAAPETVMNKAKKITGER